MDKQQYISHSERFLAELEREYYLVGSGQKEQMEIAAIYARFPELFELPSVQACLSEHTQSSSDVEARYLALFAVDGYMEDRVKAHTEEIANQELSATVPWEGEDLPLQQVRSVLAQEPDQDRRHDLHSRQLSVVWQQQPQRVERLQRLHEEAESLGFEGYTRLYDGLKGLGLSDLAEAMSVLLSETEAVYGRRLEATLAGASVHPDSADTSDVSFCFRAQHFDRYFASDSMVPSLQRTMSGLGLMKSDDFGFNLDITPRPKKSPRAFCSPIGVPDEVYLVIKPHGGSDDYDSLFHEAGHASHYSRVSADLPWSMRCLGDTDITESYAFLFHYLVHNARWLRDVLGLPLSIAEEYRSFVLFKKTWFLRRYAAKLHYELVLHSDDPAKTYEVYEPTLQQALQVRIPPENSLADVDDGFYVAQYLRAWVFEAMLRRFLEQEFGESWWTNRDAGWLLRDWWHRGQQRPLRELAQEIGFDGLDTQPLLEELMGVW